MSETIQKIMAVVTGALIAVGAFALIASTQASAAPGGMPAAHNASGSEWGMAVKGAAQAGVLSVHTSGGKAGGMPAAHEVDGKTFGSVVNMLAQSAPGAISVHVSGR